MPDLSPQMSQQTVSRDAKAIDAQVRATSSHPDAQQSQDSAPIDELADLLLRVGAGCIPSFEKVYQRTSRRLFGVILRINSDPGEAEEVLQETYVKVWTQCKQFDARRGQATHWLTGIARHGAIDSLKRKKVRPNTIWQVAAQEDDPFDRFHSLDLGPLERLILQQQAAALQHYLDALPTGQRQSLTLAFYSGLSYEQVAQQMGRPLGTVKSWVRRSLMSLKESLEAAQWPSSQ